MAVVYDGYILLNDGEMWVELARNVATLVGGEHCQLRYSSNYELGRYLRFFLGHVELALWPCLPASNQPGVVMFLSPPSYIVVPDETEQEALLASAADKFFADVKERYGDRLRFDDCRAGDGDFEQLFATHQRKGDNHGFPGPDFIDPDSPW